MDVRWFRYAHSMNTSVTEYYGHVPYLFHCSGVSSLSPSTPITRPFVHVSCATHVLRPRNQVQGTAIANACYSLPLSSGVDGLLSIR